VLARGPARATLAMLGPAFVASVAYVDPIPSRELTLPG